MRSFQIIPIVLFLPIVACGGGGGSPSPTAPTTQTPPPAPTNRSPVINSLSVAPSFGISELTLFTFSAAASDPDGDPVSYAWDLAGSAGSGTNGTITLKGSGPAVMKVTVSDGKGGSVSDTRTVTVGTATGTWRGNGVDLGTFTMVLVQTGARVTGTYSDPYFGQGQIDPAQPGSINASGHIELRTKQSVFTDFTFKGDMDSTGRRIVGQIFGSGFNGEAFTMDKQ